MSKNICVGCPVPISIFRGVVTDNEKGEFGIGVPLPSVIVTKNGVISEVDKYKYWSRIALGSLECNGGIQCLLLNWENEIKEDKSKKSKANFFIYLFHKV
jgi:hypothetical protein